MAIPKLPTMIYFLLLLLSTTLTLTTSTTLTMHNLCPYPVWPLITPNAGLPPVSDNDFKLDPSGGGLKSFSLPNTAWSDRVVARTGCVCTGTTTQCETGVVPPFTVAQLSVHGPGDRAVYSVSLVDGFNVPMTISPQAIGGGQCPVLGCTVDLNPKCPKTQRVFGSGGVVACKGPASYFKGCCPNTRTTSGDIEPIPQSCVAPGELKVIFCPTTMVKAENEEEMVVPMVVAADH